MGHHQDTKNSIVPLIDRLNKYPIGLPDSEKLRQILAILFSEEEAFVASRFPLQEASLHELVRATGLSESRLAPVLEKMADKGLVMDLIYNDRTFYLLLPGLIGFFEFTFMKKRTDLPMAEVARLMHEYLHEVRPGQAEEFFGSSTQMTRALTYEDKIPVTSKITRWEDARQIVRDAEFGAAGICFCRHQKEHLDQTCRKNAPLDGICIALGAGARFLARRGFMEEKSTDELLAILDTARRYNLTHVTDNIREKPSFICNCCPCCCELMTGIQMGFPEGVAKTPFLVNVDEEACTLCGKCIKACNVAGIAPARQAPTVRIDDKLCLGCGACLDVCPEGALLLVERDKRPKPPRNKGLMFVRILKEKKRLMPVFKAEVAKNLKQLVRK